MATNEKQDGYNNNDSSTTQKNTSIKADAIIPPSDRFSLLNRLIMRDLNRKTEHPVFSLYTKNDITRYLAKPYEYEKQFINSN